MNIPLEHRAIMAAFPELVKAVKEMGEDKPLKDYSREEMIRMGLIFIHAHQRFMLAYLSAQPCEGEDSLPC